MPTFREAWEKWLDAPSDDQATNDQLADALAAEARTVAARSMRPGESPAQNSAARVRAYLDARYQLPDMPQWIDGSPGTALMAADLEVLLQMHLLMAQLLGTRRA